MIVLLSMLCMSASMFLTLWFFRILADQEHEALKLQTRHKEQLIHFLFDHVPPGRQADKATALVTELRAEMRSLRERHNRRARWLFKRRYDAALPSPKIRVLKLDE